MAAALNLPLPDPLHLVGASRPKMDRPGNDPCGSSEAVMSGLAAHAALTGTLVHG